MMRAFVMALVCSCLLTVRADAAPLLSFGLNVSSVSSSSAVFDVNLLFTGAAGDQLEAIQLSVWGSDPLLTASDTDFSRFSFTLDSTSPLDAWSTAGSLSASGIELLFPLDPLAGPFFLPDPNPRRLGSLTVDLAGLPGGQSLVVTLASGPAGLNTDAGGILDGVSIFSASTEAGIDFGFTEPDGVEIPTNSAVPEPSTWVLCVSALLVGAVRKVRRRKPNA